MVFQSLLYLVLLLFVNPSSQSLTPLFPSSKNKTNKPFSAVIINTLEGITFALRTSDGAPLWKVKTGPPLIASTFRVGGGVGIVPGVDGSLFSLNSNGLQRFPVTAHDLLQSSYLIDDVITSSSSLLVGNKKSKMFAIHAESGTVIGSQEHAADGSDRTADESGTNNFNLKYRSSSNSNNSPLLLHRIEYTIRNVDTRSGKETWNATVSEISVVYKVVENENNDDFCTKTNHDQYVVECTHDGDVRLLTSSKEGGSNPEDDYYLKWGTSIAAHPQSCHVISAECGIVSSYDVYLDRRTIEEKQRDHIRTQLTAVGGGRGGRGGTRSTTITNDVGSSAHVAPSSLVTHGEHHRWYLGRLGDSDDDHVFAAPLNSKLRTMSSAATRTQPDIAVDALDAKAKNDKAVVMTNADGTVVSMVDGRMVGAKGSGNDVDGSDPIEWFPVEMHLATGVRVRAANGKVSSSIASSSIVSSSSVSPSSFVSSTSTSSSIHRHRGGPRLPPVDQHNLHNLQRGDFANIEELNIDLHDYEGSDDDQPIPPHLLVPDAVKSKRAKRKTKIRMRSEITGSGIVLSWRGVFATFTVVLFVVVGVAYISVRRAKKKWVASNTPLNTPMNTPIMRPSSTHNTPLLVGDDGRILYAHSTPSGSPNLSPNESSSTFITSPIRSRSIPGYARGRANSGSEVEELLRYSGNTDVMNVDGEMVGHGSAIFSSSSSSSSSTKVKKPLRLNLPKAKEIMLKFDDDVRRGDTPPRVCSSIGNRTPRSPGSKPQTVIFEEKRVTKMLRQSFGRPHSRRQDALNLDVNAKRLRSAKKRQMVNLGKMKRRIGGSNNNYYNGSEGEKWVKSRKERDQALLYMLGSSGGSSSHNDKWKNQTYFDSDESEESEESGEDDGDQGRLSYQDDGNKKKYNMKMKYHISPLMLPSAEPISSSNVKSPSVSTTPPSVTTTTASSAISNSTRSLLSTPTNHFSKTNEQSAVVNDFGTLGNSSADSSGSNGKGNNAGTSGSSVGTSDLLGSSILTRQQSKSLPKDLINSVVAGRYEREFLEEDCLGRGGFGAVYKSRNRLDGRYYAVKKVRMSSESHWQNRLEKVLREVKILALLDHTHIVRYFQAWLQTCDPSSSRRAVFGDDVTGGDFTDEYFSLDFSHDDVTGEEDSYSNYNSWGRSGGNSGSTSSSRRSLLRSQQPELFCTSSSNDSLVFDTFHVHQDLMHQLDMEDAAKEKRNNLSNSSIKRSDSQADGFIWDRGGTTEVKAAELTPPRAVSPALLHSSSGSFSSNKNETTQLRQHTSYDLILYIQMQYCDRTLRNYMDNRNKDLKSSCNSNSSNSVKGSDEIIEIATIMGSVARGIQHVHQSGLIHRDLKPDNVFLMSDGTVKLGDFGLSRQISDVLKMQQQGMVVAAVNSGGVEEDDDGSGGSSGENSTSNSNSGDDEIVDDHLPTPINVPLRAASTTSISRNKSRSKKAKGNKSRSSPRGSVRGNSRRGSPRNLLNSNASSHRFKSPRRRKRQFSNTTNTRGVGTTMYASPEQILGASYNASTDMFSLGMVLFEMCHPTFSTRMERATVLNHVRTRKYPDVVNWPFQVKHPFIKIFLDRLLDPLPIKRPSAAECVTFFNNIIHPPPRQQRFGRNIVPGSPLVSGSNRIRTGSDGTMIVSSNDGTCFLSIDCSVSRDGLLAEMTVVIRNAWNGVRILQCGSRRLGTLDDSDSGCVVEYLLAPASITEKENDKNKKSELTKMEEKGEIDEIVLQKQRVSAVTKALLLVDGVTSVNQV